jgi:hypothetical protein
MCAAAAQIPPTPRLYSINCISSLVLSPLHPNPDQPAVDRCNRYAAHTSASSTPIPMDEFLIDISISGYFGFTTIHFQLAPSPSLPQGVPSTSLFSLKPQYSLECRNSEATARHQCNPGCFIFSCLLLSSFSSSRSSSPWLHIHMENFLSPKSEVRFCIPSRYNIVSPMSM